MSAKNPLPGSVHTQSFVRRCSVILAVILASAGGAFADQVNATYVTGAEVPVTATRFDAVGKTLNVSLNFVPPPGTELLVVRNTGPNMIHGTFANLAQGQTISLTYSGLTFKFVADYHGGEGNDLVLVWTTDGDLSRTALTKLDPQLLLALKQSRALPPFDRPTRLQPRIPVKEGDRVLVDIQASVSKDLLDGISSAGGKVVNGPLTGNNLRTMVPLSQLEALAARADVTTISTAKPSVTARLKVQ